MCNNRKSFGILNTKSFVQILSEDCALLRRPVAEIGPISAAIDASYSTNFHHYSNGVYRSSTCSSLRGVAKVVRGGAAHHQNFLAHHLRWCAPGVIIYYTLENHASVPYKYLDSNGSAKLLLLQL